ncbi:MAG TPA: sodium/proton-translocating pyrophosphatase, partial [Pirellulales bacterium]|nr:sodium/proton-translocating pyrophosphatase [Pirellulales bacterium]
MKRFGWLGWAVLGGLVCFLYAGWLQAADPGIGAGNVVAEGHIAVKLWEPLTSDRYGTWEKIALVANVVVALAGLLYALMLVGQVKNAPQGTPKMQEIAQAVREGANAYLARQFRV